MIQMYQNESFEIKPPNTKTFSDKHSKWETVDTLANFVLLGFLSQRKWIPNEWQLVETAPGVSTTETNWGPNHLPASQESLLSPDCLSVWKMLTARERKTRGEDWKTRVWFDLIWLTVPFQMTTRPNQPATVITFWQRNCWILISACTCLTPFSSLPVHCDFHSRF